MTKLLNTCCEDLKSVAGAQFWLDEPLPQSSAVFKDEWEPPPSAIGTYYKTTFVRKCIRVLICEGAVHDGSTYTSLGSVSVWLLRKATAPTTADRPEWMRGERDTARWLTYFNPKEQYKKGRHNSYGQDPAGDSSWVAGGTTHYDITTSGNRQRVFDAVVAPQLNGQGSTVAAASTLGSTTLYVSGSNATSRHNANGFSHSPFLRLRIAGDDTIYTATSWNWDGGNSRWYVTITPPLQVATAGSEAITYLCCHPIPSGLPHDLLLYATTFKFVLMSKVREEVPASSPVEYRWQAGSKTIVSSSTAGTRIDPYLFYWKCEPRSYYAVP